MEKEQTEKRIRVVIIFVAILFVIVVCRLAYVMLVYPQTQVEGYQYAENEYVQDSKSNIMP